MMMIATSKKGVTQKSTAEIIISVSILVKNKRPPLLHSRRGLLYSTLVCGFIECIICCVIPVACSCVYQTKVYFHCIQHIYNRTLPHHHPCHGFCPHLYADDTQISGRCKQSAIQDLQQRLSACIDEVHSWMQYNRLQLNTNKSELLWCAIARRRHQLPRCPFRIGPDTIIPSTAVRDLGIYIDSDLSMQVHVQRSVAGCFAFIRQLRSIRRFVPSSVYQSLVVALVLSRQDYGNATLDVLPASLLNRLQSVINAAARSIAGLRRSEHITDALASFHWLRAHQIQTGRHRLPSSSRHCGTYRTSFI